MSTPNIAADPVPSLYLQRLQAMHERLGIPADYARHSVWALQAEARHLAEAGPDYYGRPQRLQPQALDAWQRMQAAAQEEGVVLHLISAFRSVDYQCQLFERKLQKGQSIEQILKVNAAPGFSEHHSGRAIDVGTDHCPALEEQFELTPAFAWLQAHAAGFGFTLSYPRNNPCGICYEPWHWCFQAADEADHSTGSAAAPEAQQP